MRKYLFQYLRPKNEVIRSRWFVVDGRGREEELTVWVVEERETGLED